MQPFLRAGSATQKLITLKIKRRGVGFQRQKIFDDRVTRTINQRTEWQPHWLFHNKMSPKIAKIKCFRRWPTLEEGPPSINKTKRTTLAVSFGLLQEDAYVHTRSAPLRVGDGETRARLTLRRKPSCTIIVCGTLLIYNWCRGRERGRRPLYQMNWAESINKIE